MVATMSGQRFGVPAPADDRPTRNAIDYLATGDQAASAPSGGAAEIYDPGRVEVDDWLGATAAYVASRPDRVRASRSGTFSAVGPLASELVSAETDADVFGPLRALRDADGWVVLAGCGLTSMTMLHLAEVEARRRPLERRELVGASTWRAYPARAVLTLAADAIRSDPLITCDDPHCDECRDAIAGGPSDDRSAVHHGVSLIDGHSIVDRSVQRARTSAAGVLQAVVSASIMQAWQTFLFAICPKRSTPLSSSEQRDGDSRFSST